MQRVKKYFKHTETQTRSVEKISTISHNDEIKIHFEE